MSIVSILWARTKATILEHGMKAAKPVSPPTQALARARRALAQSDRLTQVWLRIVACRYSCR